jgi:hypothetical protein
MAYRTKLTMDLGCELIEIGRHTYPERVEMRATGDEGEPDVYALLGMRENSPVVLQIQIAATAHGREVRSSDLLSWPPEVLAFNVYKRFAMPTRRDDQTRISVINLNREESAEITDELSRAYDAAEMWEVARVYRENTYGKPVQAVREALQYKSYGTALRRVQQARDAGFLPPTAKGSQ